MKSLSYLVLTLSISIQTNAAGTVELGKYSAVDADTKTTQVSFVLHANGTVNFDIKTPDFSMPAPGCVGKYAVDGNEFSANLKCPTFLLPQASVKIDITNITPEGLRSENGVEVDVVVDALGDEPVKFLLKKNDSKRK